MGKKRNGMSNKLKGPAKWLKNSKEARKIVQSKRDKALAAKAREEGAQGAPERAGPRRAAPQGGAAAPGPQQAARAEPSGAPPGLEAAAQRHLGAPDAEGWELLRAWLRRRLGRCCESADHAGVIAGYVTELLRAKQPSDWGATLRRELQTLLPPEAGSVRPAQPPRLCSCGLSALTRAIVAGGRGADAGDAAGHLRRLLHLPRALASPSPC